MSVALSPLVQRALATARRVGVAGPVRITRPPVIDGKTGQPSGWLAQQDVTAVELRPAQIRAFPGEAWQRAEAGVLVAAADLQFPPEPVTHRATWGGTEYQIVAVQPTAPAGVPILYAIGLAR